MSRQSLPAQGPGYGGRQSAGQSNSAMAGQQQRAFSPPPIPLQPSQSLQHITGMTGNNNGSGSSRQPRHLLPRSSGSSSSGGSGSLLEHPASGGSSGSSSENIPASTSSNPLLLSPGGSASGSSGNGNHRGSTSSAYYMGAPNNNTTVGLDLTSAAIARGEAGANYSRYSTGNLAALAAAAGVGGAGASTPPMGAAQGGRFSSVGGHGRPFSSGSNSNGNSALPTPGEETPMELETMPTLYANAGLPSPGTPGGAGLNHPLGPSMTRSRFSEYGLADNASSTETPSWRDSTLYDSNRRESMQYYGNGQKSLEDTSLLWNEKNVEADDFLHDPRTLQTARSDRWWNFPTSGRGLANAIGICVLLGGILALFMGWPVHTYIAQHSGGNLWGWGLGATNSSGQVPNIAGLPSLIDMDTPEAIRTGIRQGFNGKQYELAFSDEFNQDGRTFFPGDDPYWEAVDLHYWQTRDLEWYDPDAATTRDGKLVITMTEEPIHGLSFRSAMLQTWNKLCFNGGMYVEVSISLPGNAVASGFWPGAWTMGNLGRAGYGATNDGMWPYSYDSCDVGTLAGQMFANNTPIAAYNESGDTKNYAGRLSILKGQRASACTCKGQPHPGPKNNIGRGAPEIDILEAQVDWRGYGTASQSIQIAPFDYQWAWNNFSSDGMQIYNTSRTTLNSWKGAATQESASAVTILDTTSYNGSAYQSFGYELTPGTDTDSMITWSVGGEATWSLKAGAFKPDSRTGVGQRLMSEEPMYLILNYALSPAFQSLQFNRLQFPGYMYIDYVRVWQEKGKVDVTCDPASHPTANYINEYMEYYTNPNITLWPDELWPKNSLVDSC